MWQAKTFVRLILSRVPLSDPDPLAQPLQQDVQAYIILIVENFPATDAKIKEIIQAQDEDAVCHKIKSFCQSGWSNKSELESVSCP